MVGIPTRRKISLAITQKTLPKYPQAMRILTPFFTAAFLKTAPPSLKEKPAPARP